MNLNQAESSAVANFLEERGAMSGTPTKSLSSAASKVLNDKDVRLSRPQRNALKLVADGLQVTVGQYARAARNAFGIALNGAVVA